MIKYCKKCILPSTRPNLIIGKNGICIPCSQKNIKKKTIDKFDNLVKKIKREKSNWDCLIPVSGGKDSTWQTIKCLEKGLKPLCFSWKSPARTKLGQSNLENLIKLGVDHFDISINPKIEKTLILKAFKKTGSVAIPMHMAIYTLALDIAQKYKIKHIIFGENPAKEYGSKNKKDITKKIDYDWLKKYGVNGGINFQDWKDEKIGLNLKNLYFYNVKFRKNISVHFLGDYITWDPIETYKISSQYGFKKLKKPLVGYYDYADIDDSFIMSIHHWLKWYKFGFTRSWDNLSLEIRYGRITREQALKKLYKIGNEYPLKEIKLFCKYTGISLKDFNLIANKFRNKHIWSRKNNTWIIDNFILEKWQWNEI